MWSGWFRTTLFRALSLFLRLIVWFGYPADIDFAVIVPHTSLYNACHCLIVGSEYITRSNATSSNKTLTLFFSKLCLNWKSLRKKSKSTTDDRQLAADKARPSALSLWDHVQCIMGKTMDFPEKQKQTISYLGANWWVAHANREPDLYAWWGATQL